MSTLAVTVDNLIKNYGSQNALKGVSLEVNQGELFGIIGPDGAGKTTLIRILATLLLPDAGQAEVLGMEVEGHYRQIRNRMGYMPGRFSLYQDLTVLENLQLFASIYQTTLEENYHLIKDIYQPLEPFKNRKAGNLSGGMKQKLALSCAMIHEPEILFLDEPTTGVDPVSRNEFWEMLIKLKARGITVLVSTPYMDEADLCDRVALVQEGQILSVDTPVAIISRFPSKLFAIKSTDKYQLIKDLQAYPSTASVFAFGEYLHYTDKRAHSSERAPEQALEQELHQYLQDRGHRDIHIKSIEPTIEDCFMAFMQKEHKWSAP
ncbi:MAG: ABC transporter ATP-binding protein [Cyclobacteriaceae bacterium]|nr:ABC transporter ATP-binding protein [Cyclobacteriaceae bacterium]